MWIHMDLALEEKSGGEGAEWVATEVLELFKKGCRNPLSKKQLKEKCLDPTTVQNC